MDCGRSHVLPEGMGVACPNRRRRCDSDHRLRRTEGEGVL